MNPSPNFTKFNFANKSTMSPFSSKLIPHTPSHKNQDGQQAIKRISNFSYALSDQIGIGFTSKVFKGKNDLNGLTVAIKCIDLKNQKDSLSQEFLKQQIAILQKIKGKKSNNLLTLQGVILTSNNLYIITEFCEGKDVGKLLRHKKVISQQQAQSIMKQFILGYKQLYSLGLIHRDLKLSNLFISNGKIKLADFGFAINQNKCSNNFSYNVGSPKYMAPETLRFNNYSIKSQIWAMGVMAYEMVYGYPPWKQKNDQKIFESICKIPIQSLFDPTIQVSEAYKLFIINCLKPNANQRADKDFVFNYNWPMSVQFVEGYQQQKKPIEVIKVKGQNYAVYSSANQIKYESKQLGIQDFVNNNSIPTQFILLSVLNYCRFLVDILKNLKSLKIENQLIFTLIQQVSLSIQIIMKTLGQITCMQVNKLQSPGFESYIKTGEWKNLKQLIIRFDMEFRTQLKSAQPLRKNAAIPKTIILQQFISFLKTRLPDNARLLDKLITYYEIRQLFTSLRPIQFAEKVNMVQIVKDALLPDSVINGEALLNSVFQRLNLICL